MLRAQTVYAVGGYAIPDFASPDPIGSSTPNSGVFTTLAASGAVTGAGFTARFSAPGPIGDVTPSTGAFTTLSATNFSITKSTADVEGPSVTNTSTNAAAAAAYSAFNSAGDYVICSVLSTNAALTDQFGPGYGVVYSLKKLVLSSSDNGVFINVNGGTLVGTFTSTGLKIAGSINSRGGDNASATNSAFGEGALDSNSGGTDNTAAGNNALTANSSASYNTAFGSGALVAVTTGPRNTAIGYRAGYAVGTGALENTFVGTSTGLDLAAANIQSCVMVGYAAGSGLTGGNENTFVGTQAGVNPGGSYSNAIAIGKSAEVTASNQTVIGNGSTTETVLYGQVKGGAGTGTGKPVMVGTLSVNTTAVGNVGAGTDDLMTYSLPANSLSANGKGVRITVWGTGANNANGKTLTFLFGSYSRQLPTRASIAMAWRAEFTIIRSAASTQIISGVSIDGTANAATIDREIFDATATETDTSAITIKCTGAATSDNDIVQKGMIVEFIN